MHHFKNLCSSVKETGGIATEIIQKLSAAWSNWKRRISRINWTRCIGRMPVKLKGKFYKTVAC